MAYMDVGCVKKQVFLWSHQMASRNCRNYNFVVEETLRQIGLAHYADINYAINLRTYSSDVQEKLMICIFMNGKPKLTETRVDPAMGAINYEHIGYLKQII